MTGSSKRQSEVDRITGALNRSERIKTAFNAGRIDHGEEVSGFLLEAEEDASVLFDPADEARR